MKKYYLLLLTSISLNIYSQTRLVLNTDSTTIKISPNLYGIFYEDINHAADGGLYAELISNRSFEDNTSNPDNWTLVQKNGATGSIALDTNQPLNVSQTRALKITATNASAASWLGTANAGFWGMYFKNSNHYSLTFFARAGSDYKGSINVRLENNIGSIAYATAKITGITTEWQKYTCDLVAAGGNTSGRFALYLDSIGSVWVDVVSLFPETYNNRFNGTRNDLSQFLADMKPKFMRFPGGCFVEGDYLDNRFQWKNTLGTIENRPGHSNLWGYRTSDGLGYHEFLQLSEDLGAAPLFVVNIGIAHNDIVNYLQINNYVQDALDAIEYANGDINTTFGAMRAANGHPEPFNLKYIEIGNENNQFNDSRSDHYLERFQAFYSTIKTKYPDIKIIGNVEAWGTDNPSWKFNQAVDLVDEHYYRDPQWFISNYTKYDSYSRSGPKIYVGEYAVTSNCGNGNLNAALGEAVYMAGMERNSDVVEMCSYAPDFVNTNNRVWNPDIIVFNSSESYSTPSYYVQKLFANNLGDSIIPVIEQNNSIGIENVTGNIGLGTWATQTQYDSIVVSNKSGEVYNEQFANTTNWSPYSGTWSLSSGAYAQTSTSTDCRSISNFSVSDSVYTYTLKAKKTGGNEGFLIIFGYKNSTNFYWWNIGGWNNTQHAVERCVNGTKSIVSATAGSIATNTWYLLKIEVMGDWVKCYMDGDLINSFQMPRKLYTSASKNSETGDIILKVINPNSTSVSASVELKNKTGNSQLDGMLSVLTSGSVNDENSFASPLNVAPLTSVFSDSAHYEHTFPAYSVSVFNVKLTGNKLDKVSEKTQNSGFKIFPNPVTQNVLQVDFGANHSTSCFISILSTDGKTISKQKMNPGASNAVDISQLKSGLYYLKLNYSGKTETQKFVKL